MKVIIQNGVARSGKDQFVKFCMKYHKNSINWSTVDEVKNIAKDKFGWNGDKTDDSRKFLSEMKRIWTEYNNGPFLDMINKISNHQSTLNDNDRYDFLYFIHCREPHEIQKFIDEYKNNCITVLMLRDGIDVPNNNSDKNVDNFKYDYVIDNNDSLEDLEQKSIKFLNTIKIN